MVSGHAHRDPRLRARLVQGRAEDTLDALRVGELSVWIEQGPHAYCAVVVRGTPPTRVRDRRFSEPSRRFTCSRPPTSSGSRATPRSSTTRGQCCRSASNHVFAGATSRSRTAGGGSAPPWSWRCWRCGPACATWTSDASIGTLRRSSRNPAWSSSAPDVRVAASWGSGLRDPLTADPVSFVAASGLSPNLVKGAGPSTRRSTRGWPCPAPSPCCSRRRA